MSDVHLFKKKDNLIAIVRFYCYERYCHTLNEKLLELNQLIESSLKFNSTRHPQISHYIIRILIIGNRRLWPMNVAGLTCLIIRYFGDHLGPKQSD